MPKITYKSHEGNTTTLDAECGQSVMRVAVDNGLPGIDADCGGGCNCATCHVYIDPSWVSKVGQPAADEEAIMSLNPERQTNSRLSCQIEITDELDGLIVQIPEFQF